MTSISETRPQPALPQLPHWETTPSDLREATRAVKSAIRSRIAASGRSVEEVLAKVEALIGERVAEIATEKARGGSVWPVVDYADVQTGK